jgi:hypothetical protein
MEDHSGRVSQYLILTEPERNSWWPAINESPMRLLELANGGQEATVGWKVPSDVSQWRDKESIGWLLGAL